MDKVNKKPQPVRLNIRRETYDRLKELAGSNTSPGRYLDSLICESYSADHDKSQPAINQELQAIRTELRTLSLKISSLEGRLAEYPPHIAVPAVASEAPALSQDEYDQRQSEAQKDSPEYQDWLRRIGDGNGAVLYQKPVFAVDHDGNVVYENGRPVVVNKNELFDLVRQQLENLRKAWSVDDEH